jgi:hypothetical protein
MPGARFGVPDGWLDDARSARAINAFAMEFAVRYMSEAASLFEHDYDSAMIFLALLEANGRQNIRAPAFRVDYVDVRTAIPAEQARPISRQEIARTLGLSRETVRRKVAIMIEKGFLVEDPRGGVITTRGVIAGPGFLRAQERVIGFVEQFLTDLGEFAAPLGNRQP